MDEILNPVLDEMPKIEVTTTDTDDFDPDWHDIGGSD